MVFVEDHAMASDPETETSAAGELLHVAPTQGRIEREAFDDCVKFKS